MARTVFDPMILQIGANVDQIVTLDILCYGVIGPLYREAVQRQGGGPLCLKAAGMLQERVRPGDTVIITTGLILPGHYPYGETDGPIGTAVLARAIAIGLQAKILVVTEEELVDLNAALLRTASLQMLPADALAKEDGRHRAVASVMPLSRTLKVASGETEKLFDTLTPRAIIAVEKAGTNAKGVYHMVGGTDISDTVSKAHTLFDEARARGVLAIGIGDRGNELGFGPVAPAVRTLLPFGTECGCPCHGGVADETASDLAVPAVISNWGAYGIAACLAALLEKPDLIHTAELERALFNTAVQNGGVDGMSGRAITAADGIGVDENAAIVTLLREIYRAQSARDPSPYSTPLIKRRSNVTTHRH